MPGAPFNPMPEDDINQRIADLERLVRELMAARTLENATIAADPGLGIRTSDFDGTSFADHGTQGNYWGGDGQVAGNIYFRPGTIGNDALKNPVRGDVMAAAVQNFALSTSPVTLTSQTWALPSGFNSVTVDVTAKVYAVNGTAGLDYVYGRPRIVRVSDGAVVLPTATPTAASASGGSGTSSERYVAVVGLAAGDSITISVEGWTAFAPWAASSGNTAEVNGSLTWYRS